MCERQTGEFVTAMRLVPGKIEAEGLNGGASVFPSASISVLPAGVTYFFECCA